MPACPKLQERGWSRQSPNVGARTRGAAPLLCPSVSCQAWEPVPGVSTGPSAPASPAPTAVSSGRLSWERCAVGTPHPGHPSLHATVILNGGSVQLVPFPGPGREGTGSSNPEMHGDAGSSQGQRSCVHPHLSCKVQSSPVAPDWVTGQAGGLRHCGNSVAQPQRRQQHCLPTPTVSQRCLFFPGPRTLHGASSSFPSYLGDFNPAALTGCKNGCLHQTCAKGQRQDLSSLPELVAQGEAGLVVSGHGCMPSSWQGDPAWAPSTTDPHPHAWKGGHRTPSLQQCNPSPSLQCPTSPYLPHLVPCGSLDLHLLSPLDPTAFLPPHPVLAGPSVCRASHPHLQPCRMSAAICLSLLISINF